MRILEMTYKINYVVRDVFTHEIINSGEIVSEDKEKVLKMLSDIINDMFHDPKSPDFMAKFIDYGDMMDDENNLIMEQDDIYDEMSTLIAEK
jgi:hypothetical protein